MYLWFCRPWYSYSILPLCFRREIIDLLLFFKYLNSYVECYFSSYFELVGSLHSSRSSSNGTLLKLPRVKTTALQSSYFYRLVRLWNSLLRDIREASSVFSFKKYINNLYFSRLVNFNINERCTWSLACTCGFVVHGTLIVFSHTILFFIHSYLILYSLF